MSIFSKIFVKPQPQQTVPAVITGSVPYFTPFSGNLYESDLARAAVDSIARHIARLKGSHYIKTGNGRESGNNALNYLLSVRPNPYMSAYDALYKMATHYFILNNAFAYIQRDDSGNITAIYPLDVTAATFMTDPTDTMYVNFRFLNGSSYTLPYADIIHLRRHYNENDLLGSTNSAMLPTLQLAQAQNEGIQAGIKQGASIRGIMKYAQVLNEKDLKSARDRFVSDYLSMSNNGGIATIDSKFDYTPLEMKPYIIDADQLNAVKSKVYEYLGISQDIVSGSYDEQTGVAFFSSVVEPFAAQLSQEATAKIFTDIEIQYGNIILYEAESLDYAAYETRVSIIQQAAPYGLMTVNECREALRLPPINGDEGMKRLQTLNVVQADKANDYQLGGKQA